MARGGSRPGAGRKAGAVTKRSRATADALMGDGGVTPLDVLMTTMRDLWDSAGKGDRVNLGKRMQACAIAEKVAPYVHPKLQAVEHSGPDGGPIEMRQLTDEELAARKVALLEQLAGG